MTEVQFGKPPKRQNVSEQSMRWIRVAQALRDNPGEWARAEMSYATASSASMRASAIRRSQAKGFRVGTYDALYERDETDGRYHIWAMCTHPGEGSEFGPADGIPDERVDLP